MGNPEYHCATKIIRDSVVVKKGYGHVKQQ
jgi:hypothetical protein